MGGSAERRDARRYLCVMLMLSLSTVSAFCAWGFVGRDHFGQIPLGDDWDWYVNYDDDTSREIQDRDIFYHDIGSSLSEARNANIILLGHSLLLWGLRDDLVDDFDRQHNVRIYNLAMAGDASGEFLRLVIKRARLRPAIFVINADDRTVNFFTPYVGSAALFHESNAARVVGYSRFRSYLNVASRNLRWHLQDALARALPSAIDRIIAPQRPSALRTWRRISTGGWNFARVPFYWSSNNPVIELARSQECHATEPEVGRARDYVDDIGGTIILMLMPSPVFCPQRVREIAGRLGLETIIPADVTYTAVDGTHLDARGATAFTRFFLAALERTRAFRTLVASSAPAAPSRLTPK